MDEDQLPALSDDDARAIAEARLGAAGASEEGPRSFKPEPPVDPRWWIHCITCDERKWSSPGKPDLCPPTPTWCTFCQSVTECRVARPAHLPPEPPTPYDQVAYALTTDDFRALFYPDGLSHPPSLPGGDARF
jgi:hypothetical protein